MTKQNLYKYIVISFVESKIIKFLIMDWIVEGQGKFLIIK